MKTTHGRIHGRTIELDADLGLADGQEVEVRVQPLSRTEPWGEGLRRCAGALAQEWSEEDDRILDAIQQERKLETRREIPQ
jgi:hypothetical protein